mmetsp:Transcript_18616/g.17711  ORF Transcript_18616/g.17711 Transcript_18616/m.17711 type:complete len:128 (+) Transcript_18616:42-425(+)
MSFSFLLIALLLISLILEAQGTHSKMRQEEDSSSSEVACNPECSSDGVCVDGSCFCSYPTTGPTCEEEFVVELRFSTLYIALASAVSMVLGIVLTLSLKIAYDGIFGKADEDYSKYDNAPITINFGS